MKVPKGPFFNKKTVLFKRLCNKNFIGSIVSSKKIVTYIFYNFKFPAKNLFSIEKYKSAYLKTIIDIYLKM